MLRLQKRFGLLNTMKIKSNKLKMLSLLADLLQFICLPILSLQIFLIRRSVIELPEASGARLGRVGSGSKISILIIGDSSACGVGVENMNESLSGHLVAALKQKFNCKWKIVAQSGLTTDRLIELVMKDSSDPFDLAITAIGMNDIVAGKNAEKWIGEMLLLREVLQKKYSGPAIILSGIPPVRKLTHVPQPLRFVISFKALIFDLYLQLVSKNFNETHYIRNDFLVNDNTMAVDRFHPGSVYYKSWAVKISETIMKKFNGG